MFKQEIKKITIILIKLDSTNKFKDKIFKIIWISNKNVIKKILNCILKQSIMGKLKILINNQMLIWRLKI